MEMHPPPAGPAGSGEPPPQAIFAAEGGVATDVDNLVARISGNSGSYVEIRRRQAASGVLARWPLLREVAQVKGWAAADGAAAG